MTRSLWFRSRFAPIVLISAVCCACTVRSRRPDGPYRAAQELVDALSDLAVACTRQSAPANAGQVILTAALTPPHATPRIAGEGSSPGTEAIVACVRERAGRQLKNPETAPAPLARIHMPLPLVTSGVKYAFVQPTPLEPDAGSPQE